MTTAPADSAGTLAPAYGDKVIAVETAGAEPIPDAERHGSPLQLLWTWASPNIEFATVYIGVISVLFFGLSFWQATAAIVLGTALGAITQGFLSLDGPRFGVPQMVIGRFSFGFRGNIVPSAANGLVAGVGWFAVNSVSAAFALNTLTGLRPLPSLLLVVVAEILIGFIGHNFVHTFEKYAFPALALIFLLAGVWTFKDAHLGGGGTGGGVGGFLLAFSAAWGYAAGWNPYATDYARYLPRTANKFKTVLYPALGLFVSVTFVAVMGAASATLIAPKDAQPHGGLHRPSPVLARQLGPDRDHPGRRLRERPERLLRRDLPHRARPETPRVAQPQRPGGGLRRGRYGGGVGVPVRRGLGVRGVPAGDRVLGGAVAGRGAGRTLVPVEVHDHNSGPGPRLTDPTFTNWPGLAALLIGIAISVPLFSNQEDYVGYVPEHWPSFGDSTPIAGFVLSAVLYVTFTRIAGRASKPAPTQG